MTPRVTVFLISASLDLVNVCQTWEDLQKCTGNLRYSIFQHNFKSFTSIIIIVTCTYMAQCNGTFITKYMTSRVAVNQITATLKLVSFGRIWEYLQKVLGMPIY